MKQLRATARVEAFTLIELLVVIAIIAVLAALILPGMADGPRRAPRAMCMNNQKQIALGFIMWADDSEQKIAKRELAESRTNAVVIVDDINENNFPWQFSITNGGTRELVANGDVTSQFQTLSNYCRDVSLFICPADKMRRPARDYQTLSRTNISYFVNVDSSLTTNTMNLILTGDRHLQAGKDAVKPGLFVYTNGIKMSWTTELHKSSGYSPLGVMSFCDGHVEGVWVAASELTDVFNRQKLAEVRLLVP